MKDYEAISRVYDIFNADIDYKAWADFIEECFFRFMKQKPSIVLDLACGTGRMTFELSSRGYDMIGVDKSGEMLSAAYARKTERDGILLLNQDMCAFELYGTVGATVCCLDSINYLLSTKKLSECFSCVHNYLDPDGLFIFDVNTPYKFENIYSDNAYIFEDEESESYCGWQNSYNKVSGVCDFYLTLFESTDGKNYSRYDESQRERCYSMRTLKKYLVGAGFEFVGAFGGFDFSQASETDTRWYIVARCKK